MPTIALDDELWEQLYELTHGAAAACYQCGTCTAACPWSWVRADTVSVRDMMRHAQLGLVAESEHLWLCTTCAQCEASCPRGVPIAEVLRALRHLAWQRRQAPEGLPSLLWSLYWNSNPWTQPPSRRSQWAEELPVPAFDPAQHEILFYVGCTASYERRAQQVSRALACLLQSAGVSFGYLGDDEPCCGEAVLSVGHEPYFQEIAEQTVGLFAERGVRQIVTVSPHCYDVFENHYPRLVGQGNVGLSVFHYTEYLAALIDAGRLKLGRPFERSVTFHDPCYLARHNHQLDAPRRVLEAVPGLELLEMVHAGLETICCGGGGGRMWLETAPGERFADLRVEESLDTGAQVLATSCPFCIACLEDSLKARGATDLVVLDVAEIAALALDDVDD